MGGPEGGGLGPWGLRFQLSLGNPWPLSPHWENRTEDLPKTPLEVPWRTRSRKPQEVIQATCSPLGFTLRAGHEELTGTLGAMSSSGEGTCECSLGPKCSSLSPE